MAAAYLVKVTEQAQEQMREIAHSIAFELKAPDAALHLLEFFGDSDSFSGANAKQHCADRRRTLTQLWDS